MKRVWRVVGLAVAAGIVWLAGLVALGIWSEDACLAEGMPGVTGYTQSVRVWPPALVCVYTGIQTDETVAHTIRGLAIVGWTYAVPVLIGAGLLTWAFMASEMPMVT
jgi:hypothetical protein